jgi:cell division protein FtsB
MLYNVPMKSKIWLTLPLALGCLVMAVGMVRGESSVKGYFDLQQRRDVLKQTVDGLKTENAAIGDEIMRIKKSPAYARKVLRDKYHVTDEDEDIVFFPE